MLWYRWTGKRLEGMKVRSKVPLGNSLAEMPAGTLFTITGKWGGLELESDPCPNCGVRVRLTRAPPSSVELVVKMDRLVKT